MTPDDLRALADAIVYRDSLAIARAADYLRACADNQPYETERWNVERQSDGSLLVCFNRHERGEKCEYEHFVPAPAAPQAEPIFCRDTGCSCNDELPDYAAEQAEPKRLTVEVSLAAGHGYHGYWGVAIGSGVLRFALAAPFATLTEADEYAETLRTALGITGGSDAE